MIPIDLQLGSVDDINNVFPEVDDCWLLTRAVWEVVDVWVDWEVDPLVVPAVVDVED